jgi:hypothetical protein
LQYSHKFITLNVSFVRSWYSISLPNVLCLMNYEKRIKKIMRSESFQSIRIIVVGLVALLFALFIYQNWFTSKDLDKEATLRIEASTETFQNGNREQFRAFYDSDGSGKEPEREVTVDAIWFGHNPQIIFVSNQEGMEGQALVQSPGEARVSVSYEGIIADFDIIAVAAELGVICEPSKEIARVGEPVVFVALFYPVGVPDYRYVWSGTDNISGTLPLHFQTYNTPGIKQVSLSATDSAGSIAEANCSIEITQ